MTFANFSISQNQTVVVVMMPEGGSGRKGGCKASTASAEPILFNCSECNAAPAAAKTTANIAPADDSDELSLQGERKGDNRLDWACVRCAPGH